MKTPFRVRRWSVVLALTFSVSVAPPPEAIAGVSWGFTNNLAACPAGDTVVVESVLLAPTFPTKLRIAVTYTNASGQPKNGVPPESIWVDVKAATGNVVFNDETNGATGFKRVFADDSTRVSGSTRITVPSMSGCGTGTLKLYVSGVLQGTQTATIRTTDSNGDGRVTSADVSIACDLNYDGVSNWQDQGAVTDHLEHWRRNALHGTLVRRTSFCETCPAEEINTKGDGQIFWSPSQRFVSLTAFIDAGPGNEPSCKVFIVPSNPTEGNALTQLTTAPLWYHDYDPSWSPLNTEIVFDRGDSVIIRKPVPWLGSTETVVTASNNPGCDVKRGDDIPAISPDGRWVAFSRCNGSPTGGWSVWKVPIGGGTATQLTPTASRTDFYVSWSPDGQTIYFQRIDAAIGPQWTAWKVPAAGGTATAVFTPPVSPPDTFDVVQPGISPDGSVLVVGYGRRDRLVRNVNAHTLDPALPSPGHSKLIPNFPDTSFADKGDFPILSPRLSPDGTRLALGSKQVWAARRNMNKPPQFTSVTSTGEGTRSVADTAASMTFVCPPSATSNITVTATDPESDALTYSAHMLQSWMSWSAATRTLTVTPPSSAQGKTFYMKFRVTTASGGTDSYLGIIQVFVVPPGPMRAEGAHGPQTSEGPSPTRGAFAVDAPLVPNVEARLMLYDLAGRLIGVVRGPSGARLVWEGRDEHGRPVGSGVYLWRLEAGLHRKEGKVVVVR